MKLRAALVSGGTGTEAFRGAGLQRGRKIMSLEMHDVRRQVVFEFPVGIRAAADEIQSKGDFRQPLDDLVHPAGDPSAYHWIRTLQQQSDIGRLGSAACR